MENNKVLFITQPSVYTKICPPIGLCYLSSYLKSKGINSKVIDGSSFSWKQVKQTFILEQPKYVGLQCLTIERGHAYKMAKMVRKILPDCIILMGGQHASCFPKHMFKLAPIDFVIIGEGEITTGELIQTLIDKKEIKNVNGIAFKNQSLVILTEKRELIEDLDLLPFPDYSNIKFSDYQFRDFTNMASIMTSRGCPFFCAYCSSSKYWEKYRFRSAENVIKEIKGLYNKGITEFNFYDDNFIVNKQRMIDICKGIIDMKITFGVAGNVSLIDEDRLVWLKKAGCHAIGFGIESGSDIILKNINKPQRQTHILRAFKLCIKHKIHPAGSLMVGCPGETKETLKETAKLMNKIVPDSLSYGGILWILPNTGIYDMCKKEGFIDDDIWLKTNKDIFYTVEYSIFRLRWLQTLLMWYQARERDYKQKLLFLVWVCHINSPDWIKYILRMIYYKIMKFRF